MPANVVRGIVPITATQDQQASSGSHGSGSLHTLAPVLLPHEKYAEQQKKSASEFYFVQGQFVPKESVLVKLRDINNHLSNKVGCFEPYTCF